MRHLVDGELAKDLAHIYLYGDSEARNNAAMNYVRSPSDLDHAVLLASIPTEPLGSDPLCSIQLLHFVLTELPRPWPVFDLIRCFTRLRKALPEVVRDSDGKETGRWLQDTERLIRQSYGSMAELIVSTNKPALIDPGSRCHITHEALHDLITEFRLPVNKSGKLVVAVVLPNGPLLAAICMAVATYYTLAPINPVAGAQQFRSDIEQTHAKVIITSREDFQRLGLGQKGWLTQQGIEVFFVHLDSDMSISLSTTSGAKLLPNPGVTIPNGPEDVGLVLFTSGASGNKKLVPITTHSIVSRVSFVIDSWGLTQTDVCLNMMPLHHVGGLVRNIFAPILSGGSTICCSAFDPASFWDFASSQVQPTWYYASPSMHSMILEEVSTRPRDIHDSKIRLICNAAGGLLPALAARLRDTFHCTVLTSYGMTECMPISTPPLTYKLDRPGTSGISIGPDLEILDPDGRKVTPGLIGRICVRGSPVFAGYLQTDGSLDRSCFDRNGWFDTGDLGYMSIDRFLYITGRSKEVINRGGELISPFEVEYAIISAANSVGTPVSGRITQALAFSLPHDILQETVAIALVTPPSVPRPDLRAIQESIRPSLHQVKWPMLVVYMADLPKRNNKLQRIKLAERMGLPQITDGTKYYERHWEAAVCPHDSGLTVKIHTSSCLLDDGHVAKVLYELLPDGILPFVRTSPSDGSLQAFLFPDREGGFCLDSSWVEYTQSEMIKTEHGYGVPRDIYCLDEPVPLRPGGPVDEDKLQTLLDAMKRKSLRQLEYSDTETRVLSAFAGVLSLDLFKIPRHTDFFSLGGDSIRAGQLLSALRTEFKIQVPLHLVFNHGSVYEISSYLEKLATPSDDEYDDPQKGEEGLEQGGCEETYSSTRWWLLIVQLIPLCVVYPIRRAFQWTSFMVFLSFTEAWPTNKSMPGRLFDLILCITLSQMLTQLLFPWPGLAAKWLIIGRHREGLYPMWGTYHTRWWMVQKIVSICGLGVFKTSNYATVAYCRMMGAKIGKNVTISRAELGEWDLLDIRDDAVLDRCICRPFAGERNTTMLLGRIVIGQNASIGLSSIVAPGARVPDNTCIGPNSSSWEMQDADEANRTLAGPKIPGPHWALSLFVTAPLRALAWVASLVPWVAGLVGLVMKQPSSHGDPLLSILNWFAAGHRVGYHYLALALRSLFGPLFIFALVLIVKWILDLFFGELRPEPTKGASQLNRWRVSLIKTLLPASHLHKLTVIFRQHYEATSIALRLLGAKVGKRVYWPGTGPSIGDYHLLDVGDDVVFGSRSHLVTSDGAGSETLRIGDRAMVADRVCLLPGVDIGEETIMGSGALTRRGKPYPAHGTYVGSKGGDAICLTVGHQSIVTEKEEGSHKSSDGEQKVCPNGLILPPKAHLKPPRGSSPDPSSVTEGSSSPLRNSDVEDGLTSSSSFTSVPSEKQGRKRDKPKTAPGVSSTPFGRAFYLKQAPYHVYGQGLILLYSAFLTAFTKLYWNIPSVTSIQVVDRIFRHIHRSTPPGQTTRWLISTPTLFALTLLFTVILTTLLSLLALAAIIAAKWLLLGRCKPGDYNWDASPYCQRWQLFLAIERLRRDCLAGKGILSLLTGTYWLVLYFRCLSARVGRDCALFAGGHAGLVFTEPDLLSLGDRVVVGDDASLVAHVNTAGRFALNRLEVGDRCVLRSGARLLSGAAVRDDGCLLEHTFVMGGDVVGPRVTMQGWPAERFRGPGRIPRF